VVLVHLQVLTTDKISFIFILCMRDWCAGEKKERNFKFVM